MAPDLDVILVDGQELTDLVLEAKATELVAENVDGIELADTVDGEPAERSGGLIERLRSWFE